VQTRRKFLHQSIAFPFLGMTSFHFPERDSHVKIQSTPYDLVLVEGHRDIYEFNDRFGSGETSPLVDSMLPRYLAGGMDVIIMPVGGTHPALRGGNHKMLEGTLQVLDMIIREIDKTGGRAGIIKSKNDLPLSPDRNKVWFFLDMEGAEPIQINPESGFVPDRRMALLRNFYRMGVRGIQITHNERNYLADGIAMEGKGASGLTPFGVEVVQEMNRLGMMIGVSHLAEAGIQHVAEISNSPVVSTHTNIRPVVDTPRQHSETAVKAIASTGGLIGIRYINAGGIHTPYKLLVDEIDHISDLVGVQHTGVGWYGHDIGDPRGGPGSPNATQTEMQTMYEQRDSFIQLLSHRGYSDEHIGFIVGGNFIRIWNEILM
jgi:membrane dipeptidase